MLFNRMTIIGVGLIGGSLGLIAREKKLAGEIVGYGAEEGMLRKAVSLGAIDRYALSLPKAIEGADLIVLATPMGAFEPLCREMVPHLKKGAVVTDVGSVKGSWVARMESILSPHAFFVGGHPIAGREKSGVEAARGELFQGSRVVLTPTPITDAGALEKVTALWEKAGAKVALIDPFDHDQILGAVSHLPHLAAYALMETLTHPKIARNKPVEFSAGGLRDFTRIAASSPEMWRDIFLSNREVMAEMIDLFQETVEKIRKKILDGDGEGLLEIFDRAREIRRREV